MLPPASLSLSSWGLPFCLFCSVSRVPWFCLSRLISRLVGVDRQQLPDEGCLPLQSDKVFISPCVIRAEGGIPGWKVLPSGLEGPSLIQEPVGEHSDFLSSAVSLTPFRVGSSSFFFSFFQASGKLALVWVLFSCLLPVPRISVFREWVSCTHLLIFLPFHFPCLCLWGCIFLENSQPPNLCKLASVTFFNSGVFSCSLNVPFFGPVLISKMRYLTGCIHHR